MQFSYVQLVKGFGGTMKITRITRGSKGKSMLIEVLRCGYVNL